MNMADRIQYLRKLKGISQEELADKIGVSRQAVSKWESEQTMSDWEKVILMSDYFKVTTDYILKGIEPRADNEQTSKILGSKILYISSTALVAIGLFCAFGGWYAQQTLEAVWGAMIIQAIGIAFMPVSMIAGCILEFVFSHGWAMAPYPIGTAHTLIFGVIYFMAAAVSYGLLKKQIK